VSFCVHPRPNFSDGATVKQVVLEFLPEEVFMQDARSCANDVANAICDGLRQIGDFSYAIMPKELAHSVGDFKKAVLATIRNAVDWEIEWVDGRVAGGDKMREEWRERCRQHSSTDTTTAPGV
jgi:hypothetical protein